MTFKHIQSLVSLSVIKLLMNNQTASAFALYKSMLWANIFISKSLFDYNAKRFLKSTMYKRRMWEMYVEPKQILIYTKCTKT
jgi:hypothetical protein